MERSPELASLVEEMYATMRRGDVEAFEPRIARDAIVIGTVGVANEEAFGEELPT